MKKTTKKIEKSQDLGTQLGYDANRYRAVHKNPDPIWTNRILVFTPTTGNVRMEWVIARYSQIIPTNWSSVGLHQFMNPYVPIHYQLADAQNLMAKRVVEGNYQWVISIEHDNVMPPNVFWKFNQYIVENEVPMVSGLYFTKSDPPEPILYRGRGSSYFKDWKLGDKVWVDCVPFGCLLINAALIKAAWDESPEYWVGEEKTRRVFDAPSRTWFDEKKGGMASVGGTTDMYWCSRLMQDHILEKAGFPEYQKMENPFLVDTSLFVKHIDANGRQYPLYFPQEYLPTDPKGLDEARKILNNT